MIDFEHSASFAPFMRHAASFSGRRLESGAAESRAALHAVPCCVLGPTAIDASMGGSAPVDAIQFDVLVSRDDWPDHKPPQSGDIVTIDGFPEMRVQTVVGSLTTWTLTCAAQGGRQW